MGIYAIHETQPCFRTLKRVSLKTHTPDRQLHISGRRYYNPELGRWPSRDPIGERGALARTFIERERIGELRFLLDEEDDSALSESDDRSEISALYLFVGNSPVRAVDRLGLYTIKECEIVLFFTHYRYHSWFKSVTGADPLTSKASVISCYSSKILQNDLPSNVKLAGAVGTSTLVLLRQSAADVSIGLSPRESAEIHGWEWWEDLAQANLDAARIDAKRMIKDECCFVVYIIPVKHGRRWFPEGYSKYKDTIRRSQLVADGGL